MSKLCCFFNTPSLYRESIFKGIDSFYDCDWYFEKKDYHVEQFDTNILNSVSRLSSFNLKSFYYIKGLVPLLWANKYATYLFMGASRCLSIFIFLLLKKFFWPGKTVYLWTHGYYGKESLFEKKWKHVFFKLADGIFLYGEYARDLMVKDGFDPSRLYVIHNSLDYEKQLVIRKSIKTSTIYKEHFKNDNQVILFIGRLTKVKRLDMLIDSMFVLNEKGCRYNLVFVGDGPMSDSLKGLVEKRGMHNYVWFYGASYDEKCNAELIFNADVCVAPGNVGLTAIHSLMFGCPVISHDDFTKQMPEVEAIHDGVTGSFYKYGSQDSLTNTIEKWLSEKKDVRTIIRENCYREIDDSWTPALQMKVFNKVINSEIRKE